MKLKLPHKKQPSRRQPSSEVTRQSIYSYRSSRKQSSRPFNREEEEEKKTVSLSEKLKRYSILIGIILVIFYVTMLLPDAEVHTNGQSVQGLSRSEYTNEINAHLRKSLANYSKLFIKPSQLSEELLKVFPEVHSIEVKTRLFSPRPVVRVSFAAPAARLILNDNKSYILDEQGKILIAETQAAPYVNVNELITIRDPGSLNDFKTGQSALSQMQIQFVSEISAQSKAKNINIESVTLGSGSEVNARYKDSNYLVKYSYLANARRSSGAYFAIREQLEREKVQPREYIDLRIPDRAYVK